MALQPFVGPWPLFNFLTFFFYTDSRTPWTEIQPVARPLSTCRTTQTQNKRTQTSMRQVGFEPTIPVFELTKTVHDFDLIHWATNIYFCCLSRIFNLKLYGFFGKFDKIINRKRAKNNNKLRNLTLFAQY
jgi:hypothetical protein